MSLVLDCSATLAFILPDETTPEAEQILEIIVTDGAWVPSLWRLEVANSLSAAVRRKRITQAFRDQALADLALLNIRTDLETDPMAWTAMLGLADRFGLTLYDAAYLELSLRRNLRLATYDAALVEAASAMGTPHGIR